MKMIKYKIYCTKNFIRKAFKGHRDKHGIPYVRHCVDVAEKAVEEYGYNRYKYEIDNVYIIGLLHDVVEDTDYTLDDLRKEGYEEEIIKAVEALTHRDNEPYVDYIIRVSKNPLAKYVKRGDLICNSDIRRTLIGTEPTHKTINRLVKYYASYTFLRGDIGEEEYKNMR